MTTEYLDQECLFCDEPERCIVFRNTENKLAFPQTRTDYLKISFWYCGALLKNNIPPEKRKAVSLHDLRQNLVPTARSI